MNRKRLLMIYIKCNKDNVPHNYNFANAYYGFREMGAEIKFYKEIKDIYIYMIL